MLDRQKLAERLRMERARKKVTQVEVADATRTTGAAICAYENGARTPTLDKLEALADYYGVTTDYLLGK